MNNFWNELGKYQQQNIYERKKNDVLAVIEKSKKDIKLSLNDFITLISPVATDELDTIALLSRQKTQKRFGKTIQLYIPLYLSNYCSNNCVYCGFNAKNHIKRIILDDSEILKEVEMIKNMEYEHILLVTGENSKKAGIEYLLNAIKLVKPYFFSISAEIQPLKTDEYKLLIKEGLSSVYIYQETYNKEKYSFYHPIGKKSDYHYRLETPDRLGTAGIYRIGLGILLGLENWRKDAISLALHLRYLQKKYWRTKYSLSFPRIRPNAGKYKPNHPVNDKEFAQLIWAFRLFDEDIEIALTTRESIKFRNNMLTLGITSMSAGSKTDPGGYYTHINELKQFEVNDNRSPQELVKEIEKQNYTAIWKDWDNYLGK
jgi:2-iminoacetate synthase